MTTQSELPLLAEVVTLYNSNARDIPAMLRKLADQIEQARDDPDTESATCAVCVVWNSETGRFATYGWGDTNLDSSIAFLRVAEDELVRVRKINGSLWPVPVGGVK